MVTYIINIKKKLVLHLVFCYENLCRLNLFPRNQYKIGEISRIYNGIGINKDLSIATPNEAASQSPSGWKK